jgi:hypothetical protein
MRKGPTGSRKQSNRWLPSTADGRPAEAFEGSILQLCWLSTELALELKEIVEAAQEKDHHEVHRVMPSSQVDEVHPLIAY